MENGNSKISRRELEKTILEKVGQAIASINDAKHLDEVICALHSLAVLLFPLDSRALSGSIDQQYRGQVLSAKVPSEHERSHWWRVFYQGAAFPTLARVLLYDVASNWLACFPFSARKHVYDVFFVNGCTMEVVLTVVPSLRQNESGSFDINAVRSNAERVLVLCLLENDGVLRMAREFGSSCQSEEISTEQLNLTISRVAQLLTSIPDKAQLGTSNSLSSHFFFKQITLQLIGGAEEWDANLCNKEAIFDKSDMNGTIQFVGESFARICRRGSSDLLLSEVIPQILRHVQSILLSNAESNADVIGSEVFEAKPGSWFWFKLMEAIKDPYAVERLAEQLLLQLASEHVTDVEAYWILWILFHRIYEHQTSVRNCNEASLKSYQLSNSEIHQSMQEQSRVSIFGLPICTCAWPTMISWSWSSFVCICRQNI